MNQTDLSEKVVSDLVSALCAALPFVEDALSSEDFKAGYVASRVTEIRAALKAAGAL